MLTARDQAIGQRGGCGEIVGRLCSQAAQIGDREVQCGVAAGGSRHGQRLTQPDQRVQPLPFGKRLRAIEQRRGERSRSAQMSTGGFAIAAKTRDPACLHVRMHEIAKPRPVSALLRDRYRKQGDAFFDLRAGLLELPARQRQVRAGDQRVRDPALPCVRIRILGEQCAQHVDLSGIAVRGGGQVAIGFLRSADPRQGDDLFVAQIVVFGFHSPRPLLQYGRALEIVQRIDDAALVARDRAEIGQRIGQLDKPLVVVGFETQQAFAGIQIGRPMPARVVQPMLPVVMIAQPECGDAGFLKRFDRSRRLRYGSARSAVRA